MKPSRLILGLLAGGILGAGTIRAEDPTRFRPDPEQTFKRMDANGDGKLSKEEFQRFAAFSPRFKGNPDAVRQTFEGADTNKDGFLSQEEFTNLSTFGAPGLPPMPPAGNKPEMPTVSEKPASAEQLAFFENKIRPVLVQQCYDCHSAQSKKVKGGLLLDTRDGTRRGGEKGPAVVPGDLDKSLLIAAIRGKDEDFQMPPKKKLPAEVVADFETWVKAGAADPRDGKAIVTKSNIDIEKGKQFWAFQQPKKSPVPPVADASWPKAESDRFVLAAMEAKGVKPVADADRATLLRRISFDLVGLPPTPADVQAFMDDKSADSIEKVVDRLLASPAFGERWGRYWLDVARYAESSGKQVNVNYPHAWRYRDYVIDSFNHDKPFDLFIREQIAGDLMTSKDEKQKAERIVATGFLAIGTKSHNERNPMQFELDLVDEQIDATSQAILGMTFACARCHDHKFDPVAQRDYYALAGIFRSTDTLFGTVRAIQNAHATSLLELSHTSGQAAVGETLTPAARADLETQLADLKKERQELFKQGREKLAGNVQVLFLISRIAQTENRLSMFEADGTPKILAMGVRDRYRPTDSALYVRGELDSPSDRVPRGIPQVLTTGNGEVHSKGSGRLELADFLGSSKNPLTARVWVNRVWLHLFGQGIVPTPDNFGASGQLPTNQPLLDNLAIGFMENGWSTKKLVRQLVLSHAYQIASSFDSKNNEIDPDNVLGWRAPKRRLDAEGIRDSLLTASGQIDANRPLASAVARIGDLPIQAIGRFGGGAIDAGDKHRSVYLPIIRDQLPEALATFDFAESSLVVGQRATTSVPSQSLYLLNSPFVINAADATAGKLLREPGDDASRIRQAYLQIYGRVPTPVETAAAGKFVSQYAATISSAATVSPAAMRDAWTAFVQALMGSAEFLYLN